MSSDYDQAQEIDDLQKLLRKTQAEAARNKRRTDDMVEAVYQAASAAARASGRGLAVKRPPVDKRRTKPEVALIHATDWQLGKKTASYDIATCDRRMDQFVDKVIRITNIQRADHPVREAVLMLGGDMVENTDLFAGQAWEIEAHLFEQLFETARIIEKMVRTLAGEFEKLRVVCEYGNHGRIGRFGVLPKGDNVDRMAYRIAADRTTELKNVAWQMSDAGYQHFTIGKYRCLLVHGDEIRSMGNTPIFSILRRFTSWSSGVMPDFDEAFMGHYHTPLSLTLPNSSRVYVTGSSESGSVYATETIGAVGKPSQRLHFISPEKGHTTAEFIVWLD